MFNSLILIALLYSQGLSAGEITAITDLSALGERIRQSGTACALYVSRDDCPYCRRLEKEVLVPMAKGGELDQLCLVEFEWNAGEVVDFAGGLRRSDDIVAGYSVTVTPTVVFVGADGEQLNDQLIGYQGSDLYFELLRKRLRQATERLNTNGS